MELNFEGIAVGAASLMVIGAFHPLVIWCEYHFSQKIWPLFLLCGLICLGLALFARAPTLGNFWLDVLPGMLLMGVGAGIAFNPLLMAAMQDVAPEDAGLASGLVNTAFMLGGALGLAVLASLAAARTSVLATQGHDPLHALNGGYQVAFGVGALFALAAAALGGVLLRAQLKPGDHAASTPVH